MNGQGIMEKFTPVADVYAEQKRSCLELLAAIQRELQEEPACADISWAHVLQMGRIHKGLLAATGRGRLRARKESP